MEYKRLTIISGHYGSGKTNVAINMAFELRKKHKNVVLADLDIVNPYFRSKDSEMELANMGIRLICSPYANSNIDVAALPQEIYSLTDDLTMHAVIDLGGDERGVLALGRIAEMIKEENNYQFLLVLNRFRPLTSDTDSLIEVKYGIEAATQLKFTGIVNNSNLGMETTPDVIVDSLEFADNISNICAIPVVATSIAKEFYDDLANIAPNIFPMSIQRIQM